MSVNTLGAENYYDDYGNGGGLNWDLKLMLSAMDTMDVARDTTFDSLRQKQTANFLMLGSATPQNLDNLALLDKKLRPGLGAQDSATVVDYNMYPLQMHQERVKFLEEWEANNKRNNPNDVSPLPYPKFNLVQADMKDLPVADKSVDVVVSDYTLNFAQTKDEVEKTFAEVSRVLSDDGFLIFSVRGNPDRPYSSGSELTPNDATMAQKELSGGVVVNQLPLATYLGLAQQYGLQIVENDQGFGQSEILCGVLKKAPKLEA